MNIIIEVEHVGVRHAVRRPVLWQTEQPPHVWEEEQLPQYWQCQHQQTGVSAVPISDRLGRFFFSVKSKDQN